VDFHYLAAERVWLFRRADGVDVAVGGDDDGADPDRMALTERAVAAFDTIKALALKHLDFYAARDRVAPGEAWLLEAIECGRDPADPPNTLHLYFTLAADAYGWWSVTFTATAANFYPKALRRLER
jgi:hypothetical protein